MAIGATGCVLVASIERLAVAAGVELQLSVVVTVAAVDRLQSHLVGMFLDVEILVAVHTVHVPVHGRAEDGFLHQQHAIRIDLAFQLGRRRARPSP